MSTSTTQTTLAIGEILPLLDDDALRIFLNTGVLPNPLPEPKPEVEPELNHNSLYTLHTCPSEVYSVKYKCMLPGWVYKMGYDI